MLLRLRHHFDLMLLRLRHHPDLRLRERYIFYFKFKED